MSSDPVVRCWNCNLNQFAKSESCRRCRQPLEKPREKPKPEQLREKERGVSWNLPDFHKAISKQIGERVRFARKQRGLSQKALSKLLNNQRTYITKLEYGRVEPTISQLGRIANALQIPLVCLIESEEERHKRLILADPFMQELLQAGTGMPVFFWKKTADEAKRLSHG